MLETFGMPSPRQTESGTMPGQNGFRLMPMGASVHPENTRRSVVQKEPVHATEPGASFVSFEYGELLPRSCGFQCEPVARYEERTNVRDDDCNGERIHRSDISRAAFDGRNEPRLNPLILLTDQVLMTHNEFQR
jgi:hypothetical protein